MKAQDVLLKVDLDGVIRNWNASLVAVYKKLGGGLTVYPFAEFGLQSSFPDCPNIKQFFNGAAAYEIYRNAKPYAKAIEFLELLISRFPNVWLVTTQFPNTMFPTMEWIETYIPSYTNLPVQFSAEKGIVGRGKFKHTLLIDDAPHNLDSEVRYGGTALCFGQLYNFDKPNHNTWVNFFGDTDFSLEAEPARLEKQYAAILNWLDEWFLHRCTQPLRLTAEDCSCWGDQNGMATNPQCLIHGGRR